LLIGPSCAILDSQGRLVWCADNDHALMHLEKDGTLGAAIVLAEGEGIGDGIKVDTSGKPNRAASAGNPGLLRDSCTA
jgi:hypothetical protein